MNTKTQYSMLVVSMLALAYYGASSFAADNDYKSVGTTTQTPAVSVNRFPIAATPTKLNKATGLIGMEVRNQGNEKLGSIKDFVIDLNSGKVSYVVMDAGNLIRNKLFAVPLNGFKPGSDQNHLVLNADKKKMETARGFDSEMWPNVSDPLWGAETFWEPSPSIDRPQQDRYQQDRPQ